jgi:hypothetical protein
MTQSEVKSQSILAERQHIIPSFWKKTLFLKDRKSRGTESRYKGFLEIISPETENQLFLIVPNSGGKSEIVA